MSQLQSSLACENIGVSPLQVEFHYEPIFWVKSQSILAYEQLARRPGDFDASFLSEISQNQTTLLDLASIETAFAAVKELKSPVFINAFPKNVERLAHRLSISADSFSDNVGLEVNEDVPLDLLIQYAKRFPDVWWILDDLDVRKDAFDTIANPFLRSLPLTAKFHAHSTINNRDHLFDTSLIPQNWTIVVEGVKPDMLSLLKQRGINFAQGRDLGRKQGNVTGLSHRL
jgi:hypothetical protein